MKTKHTLHKILGIAGYLLLVIFLNINCIDEGEKDFSYSKETFSYCAADQIKIAPQKNAYLDALQSSEIKAGNFSIEPKLPMGLNFDDSKAIITGSASLIPEVAQEYSISFNNKDLNTSKIISKIKIKFYSINLGKFQTHLNKSKGGVLNYEIFTKKRYEVNPLAHFLRLNMINQETISSLTFDISPALPTGINFNTQQQRYQVQPSLVSPKQHIPLVCITILVLTPL